MVEYAVVQSVDIIKYTDEEYEKHLRDPVSTVSEWIVFVQYHVILSFDFAQW